MPPKPPAGLATAGRKLWRDITSEYELDAKETVLLEKSCRCLDELSRLETALVSAPDTVTGSTGQVKPNPLFAEVRSHRLTLEKLLAAVKLPVESTTAGAADASEKARQAARARWSRRGLGSVGA